MKKILAILFIFLTSICLASGHFELAKRHMEEGKFQEAITELEGCLATGQNSAKVYYNLGIAHHRLAHLGEAIFYLRQAKILNPRDSDIDFNLAYIQKTSQASVETGKNIYTSFLDKWPLNEKESLYFLVIIAVLSTIFAISALILKATLANSFAKVGFALTLVAAATYAYKATSNQAFGVIISQTANVYSGKGISNVLLFTLHAGTEFQIKEQEEGWLRINLGKDKSGWLASGAAITTKK